MTKKDYEATRLRTGKLADYPDVLDVEQMCELLRISTKMGYKLLRENKIKSIKIENRFRIPKAHLCKYLKI
jgi:excisionase family DNA binding protein